MLSIIEKQNLKEFCFEHKLECGVDEAGRGPFLGRIYAAAVIWPRGLSEDECQLSLNDSKKLNRKKRNLLTEYIEGNAIDYCISYVEPWVIDKIGINEANDLVMHNAIKGLKTNIDMILVDGNRFKKFKRIYKIDECDEEGMGFISHKCIIKGDGKYCNIAAASILAKEYHDRYIEELCKQNLDLHIHYDILNNMGYGTKKHREGLMKYGATKYHRKQYVKKYIN